MAGAHAYVRVPPDSTGKKIFHSVAMEIAFNGGVQAFRKGDVVTFSTSTFTGTVVDVLGAVSIGEIHISISEPIPSDPSTVIGENIFVGGIIYASVSDNGVPLYMPHTVISGGNNPDYSAHVTKDGAIRTSFPGGSPVFDAFGRMQISEQTTLSEYIPVYDLDSENISITTAGSGNVSLMQFGGSVSMSVGSEAGANTTRMSDLYHPYIAGSSQSITITAKCGDVGKIGNVREWGYGDERDALMFQLRGIDVGILVRGSSTGSIIESFIPQEDWNEDKLDGSRGLFNPSGVSLNINTINTFWLDFSREGAGSFRFGIYADGIKIICHAINVANTGVYPLIRTGSLPFINSNYNSGATASTSELTVWNIVTKTGGKFDPEYRHFCTEIPLTTLTSTEFTPLVSFRPKQLFNGMDNRLSGYGTIASFLTSTEPIIVAFFKNATPVGATWGMSPDPLSSMEADMTATSQTGGRIACSGIVAPGSSTVFELSSLFNNRGEAMRRKANIEEYDSYTIAIKLLSGTTTSINGTIGWKEL